MLNFRSSAPNLQPFKPDSVIFVRGSHNSTGEPGLNVKWDIIDTAEVCILTLPFPFHVIISTLAYTKLQKLRLISLANLIMSDIFWNNYRIRHLWQSVCWLVQCSQQYWIGRNWQLAQKKFHSWCDITISWISIVSCSWEASVIPVFWWQLLLFYKEFVLILVSD